MSLEVEGSIIINGKDLGEEFEKMENKLKEIEKRLEDRVINKKNILKIIELYELLSNEGLKENNNIAEIIVMSHEIDKNDE